MSKGFSGVGISVLAAVALSLVVTPMVIGSGNALATTDRSESPVLRVSIAPIEAAQAAPEPCLRKVVRIVYSGYAAAPAECTQTR